jgi:L-ascorbate metabolism protein UlaG (beta-lactamase superfamily)
MLMSRYALAVMVLAASLVAALDSQLLRSQDKKAPPEISWHGQSFFTLKTGAGTTIAFDPHALPEYGRILNMKADIILLSHNHNDHTQVGVIENFREAKIIRGLSGAAFKADWAKVDEKIKDVRIYNIPTYHDTMEGFMRGKNSIFVVEVDGWRIAHLGDLGHPLSREQLKKLGEVDVAMVPVGGIYALNGSEAKEVIAQIKPKEYIFPMHCGTKVYEDLLPVDEFIDGQDKAKVVPSDDNRIVLNRDAQRPRPLIVLLHYWPKAGK